MKCETCAENGLNTAAVETVAGIAMCRRCKQNYLDASNLETFERYSAASHDAWWSSAWIGHDAAITRLPDRKPVRAAITPRLDGTYVGASALQACGQYESVSRQRDIRKR